MSDDDLIRKSDALYAIAGWDIPSTAIAALPAVTVGVEPLRDLLEAWVELASHCTIQEGVCCCGDNMEGHSNPMDCGHSPVDHGSYIADHLGERTRAALPQERQDKIKAEADRLAALDDLAHLGQEFDAAPATHLHANKGGVLDDDLYDLLASPDPTAIREAAQPSPQEVVDAMKDAAAVAMKAREAALREAAEVGENFSGPITRDAILALIQKGDAE